MPVVFGDYPLYTEIHTNSIRESESKPERRSGKFSRLQSIRDYAFQYTRIVWSRTSRNASPNTKPANLHSAPRATLIAISYVFAISRFASRKISPPSSELSLSFPQSTNSPSAVSVNEPLENCSPAPKRHGERSEYSSNHCLHRHYVLRS